MNTDWKLTTPPESEVHVDTDVLAMRAPLVRVHRDDEGTWSFDGPGQAPRPSKKTVLSAVVGAWPHVAALSDLDRGGAVVWSWKHHGWASEFACRCGNCEQPVATDIDRGSWPSDLQPHIIVNVEQAALSGQVSLTDMISTPGGIALLGPGDHRRTADVMTPVALANVIRRWPHTMQALRALKEGRGMRWNPENLSWHEYVVS
ncbi:hypothetical protein GCM10011581_05240 [Saccharopolyspora subtropica]|uniref:Uncharacterized protein n=1 Tax=Saccharopolyspora thermophila TaxID=89367 RepID=A0A917JJJ1_9PSEU|nr:hypothetical protein [Saccharopolyspora subtropica]GGI71181.1 hypothetical protein GCM10011581_05240 [Saccharopolyspora subtropica]